MALMLAVLLLIALVGSRLGLFTDLDEEPHIREDADKIVVGVSQLGSESGWRSAKDRKSVV